MQVIRRSLDSSTALLGSQQQWIESGEPSSLSEIFSSTCPLCVHEVYLLLTWRDLLQLFRHYAISKIGWPSIEFTFRLAPSSFFLLVPFSCDELVCSCHVFIEKVRQTSMRTREFRLVILALSDKTVMLFTHDSSNDRNPVWARSSRCAKERSPYPLNLPSFHASGPKQLDSNPVVQAYPNGP